MNACSMRPWLFALLVACSAGPSIPPEQPDQPPSTRPKQPPEVIPDQPPKSPGWFCFTMIRRNSDESSEDISDCQRTIEECNYLRYDYVRSDEFDVTTCGPQPEASCFKVKHRVSGVVEDQCSANMPQCTMRRNVVGKYPEDWELIDECSRTR